ncbi:type IX secretion system outer membrane channel protein PorV [Arcicella lustrica]|uniref:Type IX secretion system outer membrane channel protein PorV n=1 Tax=Arcicella lustrica TaxID=2984196 RepID=A0ABU5SIV5_9BACT|nr:type IX secretion system outer membrane channel protein PorV [Arcicella sp. DC25W]MEA5427218.1 type IX secretion system outer membrane channel protein PorV [Arcicella sp. DC25W]
MIKKITSALRVSLLFGLTVPAVNVFAQTTRTPSPVIQSLIITPDARSAAMGDAGVALSPGDGDANSIFWNPGKIPFSGKDMAVSVSYTPWLRQLVNDMGLLNASFYKKIQTNQAIGLSVHYFDQGEFQATNKFGESLGSFNSKEYSVSLSYSRKLSEKLGLGVNVKYINSALSPLTSGAAGTVQVQTESTVGADIGLFHTSKRDKPWNYNWGVMIQNISGRVSYGLNESNFIPTNLKAGFAAINTIDQHNKLTLTADINKLMVPTPKVVNGKLEQPSTAIGGILGSFGDAPDGFSEELKEINLSLGAEYLYNDLFALRGGYFFEDASKGGRKYFTAGFGVKLEKKFGLDFAYLIPVSSGNALAQTLRLSLHANFNAAPKVATTTTN